MASLRYIIGGVQVCVGVSSPVWGRVREPHGPWAPHGTAGLTRSLPVTLPDSFGVGPLTPPTPPGPRGLKNRIHS